MQDIDYTKLIITCEACGNVKRYEVGSQAECDRIFREFHCENGCGRNLYSFITVGTLKRKTETKEENSKELKSNHKNTKHFIFTTITG